MVTPLNCKIYTDKHLFLVGKHSQIISKNKILLSNSLLTIHASIKNESKVPTTVYIGYAVYSKNKIKLDNRNFPYNNHNTLLKVISHNASNCSLVVDGIPQWVPGCYLAFNAQKDLSDVPNFCLAKINTIKKLSNGQSEITYTPSPSTKKHISDYVRVHGVPGSFLYTNIRVLQPGELFNFSSQIRKDDNFYQYNSKAFSRGSYYVSPIVLSHSSDPSFTNTISILKFDISF